MASDSQSHHSLKIASIVFLLIFQITSSIILHEGIANDQYLQHEQDVQKSQSNIDLNIDYGHEFGGQTIDFHDLNQATVRHENNLRVSYNHLIHNNTDGIIGVPDVVISDHQEVFACWINDEGGVFHYSLGLSGDANTMQVDSLSEIDHQSQLVDCAIGIKENNRTSLLYSNGTALKAAQIAYKTALYSDGDAWHTRTILEDINVTNIELAITPNLLEWGAFVDDEGRLYRVNYSGAYWETGLLDSGPVGKDFELLINLDGAISIFYTKSNQAILMKISNGNVASEVVSSDINLHHDLGITQDNHGFEHMFTSSYEANNTTFNIKRSLANQPNQIASNPTKTLISEVENSNINSISYGDFNSDGYDDIVFSEYNAGINQLTENGIVSVYYGDKAGLYSSANQTWYGLTDAANFGQAISVGDYDGDGYSDLAISSPGTNSGDGMVEFTFGSVDGLSQILTQIDGVSIPTLANNRYGSCLETVQDLNNDGKDEILICSSDYDDDGDTGLVQLFSGDLASNIWLEMNSPNQVLQGPNFGQSVSASGDLNGDGITDLAIGNTGTMVNPAGYSSVEIRYGSSNGFNEDPDFSLQAFSSDTLFGYEVGIINDLNRDGFDELFISEPYNISNEFNGGSVWIFLGNDSGLSAEPDFRLNGASNELLGLNFASAGDSNGDGFNDFLITKKGLLNSGELMLYLGSNNGFQQTGNVVSTGNHDLGLAIVGGLDSNGDGMDEYFLSQSIVDDNSAQQAVLEQYTRRAWDYSAILIPGLVDQAKIRTSSEGSPTIVYTVNISGQNLVQLISITKDSQSGYWSIQNLTTMTTDMVNCNFATTSAGEPVVFISSQQMGISVKTFDSFTAIGSQISSLYSDAKYFDSAINIDGNYYLAYYSPTSSNLYLKTLEDGVWSEQLIELGATMTNDINLLIDANNEPTIVYLDSTTNQIMTSHNQTGWNFQPINTANHHAVHSFSSLIRPNNELSVVTIMDDGNNKNLTVINWNGSYADMTFIAGIEDGYTNVSISSDNENKLIVSTFSSTGLLTIYEQSADSATWNIIMTAQSHSIIFGNQITSLGGEHPVIAVSSEHDTIRVRNNGVWQTLAGAPDDYAGGNWELIANNSHIILLTESATSNDLQWNSIATTNASKYRSEWYSSVFEDMPLDLGITSVTENNSVIRVTLHESRDDALSNLRLYTDQDGDHIFDEIDELPLIPNQWFDSDGDGYGENTLAPLHDSCVENYGNSYIINFGCDDFDEDGYEDSIDSCNSVFGFSWLDRKGCADFDQDGWSDAILGGIDIFSDNWKQAFDSDGDQYGDNHGPDCCDTWYDNDARPGDLFPYNPRQFEDSDGDGYGDNLSDFITRDDCRFDYGTSYRDRLGCLDTDGDGSSDPSPGWGSEGCITSSGLCADNWPNDPTQWTDSDGDGYGDNTSIHATEPDHFPNNIAAHNDTDNDGYPDHFSVFYNGTNSGGLILDSCPTIAGNSTSPLFGCLDTDGDNYMDSYTYDIDQNTGLRVNQSGDAFPFDAEQWSDADGDGFGDFSGGADADQCPYIPGITSGTLGVGCPIIDDDDDDGDSVNNENDRCPATILGLPVNVDGCAINQLDTDEDGVTDDLDICPETSKTGLEIDSLGCSKSQREVDSDGDSIFDYEDICPDTPTGELVDQSGSQRGCSASQKDTDSDGVSDAIDECPDTQANIVVTPDGCTDEVFYQDDIDGDGYSGDDDFMPGDSTQWIDSDGDGYGDNRTGFEGDQCPQIFGQSYQDRFGCLDTDLDGWSDPTGDWLASPNGNADAFFDDPSQWRDLDGDLYGDNISGNNPDLCVTTNALYITEVDTNGCAEYERDTDQDGVVDSLDECPTKAMGIDGNLNGCPVEQQAAESESVEIFGLSITIFIIICISVVLLLVVIIVLLNREDDEDWYDDDDEDWYDDDETDALGFLDQQSRPSIKPPISRSPSPSPTPRNTNHGSTEFTPRQNSNPSKIPNRKIAQKTNNRQLSTVRSKTKVAKKVRREDVKSKKIKRAIVEIEEDIFENVDDSLIELTIAGVINNGLSNERKVLMNLQESGWNARQSRAIINMAKKRSR